METGYYIPEESLGFMTATANRVLNTALRRELKTAGLELTPEQWGVLVILWQRKNATQDELAQVLCTDKSTMSRILSLMKDKQLITRRIDPDNERKKIITAAERAFALREQGYTVANQALQGALQGVSAQDAQVCMRVLTAIKANLTDSQGH